ncbi:aspartate carbamoyltransferase [Nonomuraea basaltis]|uniref:aspartate carbamoyltransferase n=1 Tax=Nonomuraea basaltis TaxID=2495887 RepID=UPI00110C6FE3|nr:aspartate carbamoyltransferase [Nonomuraea basaltis]TMS00579.1 aspartate carbamoyltransferase [Nonomuraea basaltis]
MSRDRWMTTAVIVMAALAGCGGQGDRQAEVAAKGSQVMPFDLERTTHTFAKGADGGVQTVVADDPSDSGQIRLVREHVTQEAAKFARGDFGDPAAIHGDGMPGLTALSQGYARITTSYAEVPAGARITYRTEDPALVKALHAWFDAQVSDHGAHAEHG